MAESPGPAAKPPLVRRVVVEGVGTGALVAVVVGSGIQATNLTGDVGLRLLANSLATVFGLGVLIVLLGPVSGAHFNPAVTLAAWYSGRRVGGGPALDGGASGPRAADDTGLSLGEAGAYVVAQIVGALGGAVLADAMFGRPLVAWSAQDRSAPHLWLSEVVATAGLVWLIGGLSRTGRDRLGPAAVASYIGAAYWFTASTSFANPAVTLGRSITDTFAGIAPASVPPFLAAQLVGAIVGIALTTLTFGRSTGPPQQTARPSPGAPQLLPEAGSVGIPLAAGDSQAVRSSAGVPQLRPEVCAVCNPQEAGDLQSARSSVDAPQMLRGAGAVRTSLEVGDLQAVRSSAGAPQMLAEGGAVRAAPESGDPEVVRPERGVFGS